MGLVILPLYLQPLHPSGLSTWYKKDPGKKLLVDALNIIKDSKSWQLILKK